MNLWRSTPTDHEQFEGAPAREPAWTTGAPNFHIGRIGELVGFGNATPHRVPARPYPQKALIYFAMPANAARFPCPVCPSMEQARWAGRTVTEWLADVYSKSRVYK